MHHVLAPRMWLLVREIVDPSLLLTGIRIGLRTEVEGNSDGRGDVLALVLPSLKEVAEVLGLLRVSSSSDEENLELRFDFLRLWDDDSGVSGYSSLFLIDIWDISRFLGLILDLGGLR